MKKFNHIIVGIDFSPGSRSALATAVRFAARDEAKVTAVHVIDPILATELKTAHGFTDKQLFDSVAGRVRHFMDQTEVGADLVDIDLDVGNAFSIRIGDIVPVSLYSVGFARSGGFGVQTLIRIVGLRFEEDSGRCEIFGKEVRL